MLRVVEVSTCPLLLLLLLLPIHVVTARVVAVRVGSGGNGRRSGDRRWNGALCSRRWANGRRGREVGPTSCGGNNAVTIGNGARRHSMWRKGGCMLVWLRM